jgi:hypothetical protein
MNEQNSYQLINILSRYILEENTNLHNKISEKDRIIKFIGYNLPHGYYLCGICYIPSNDNCKCTIQHCIKCCTALNDVYMDIEMKIN